VNGNRWLVVVVGGAIAIWVAFAVIAVSSYRNVGRLEEQLIASCERGNLIRERQNTVIRTLKLDLAPLPRVDCRSVVKRGS
jgi:hypothetical protein